MQDDFMSGAVDTREPYIAGHNLIKTERLAAAPEQRLAGFQLSVTGRRAGRGGYPVFDGHGDAGTPVPIIYLPPTRKTKLPCVACVSADTARHFTR